MNFILIVNRFFNFEVRKFLLDANAMYLLCVFYTKKGLGRKLTAVKQSISCESRKKVVADKSLITV